MKVGRVYRKRIKHYEEPGHLRELTFSCFNKMPLLTNDTWLEMLSRSIVAASERHNWRLTAFVFMPDHVHLLFFPLPGASKVYRLLNAIKRPYSYRIKQTLIANHSPLLSRLTVRQRPGVTTFRYWQEGPGYDRNIESQLALVGSIDYLHLNPIRRNLCEQPTQWKWSSARFHFNPLAPADPDLPRLEMVPADFFVLTGVSAFT